MGADRGLVVPLLRDADQRSFPDVETTIRAFGKKAQDGTLSYEELNGGTFTITNGGIFGSLLSTPILNPPGSPILGMHSIKKRAIVVDDELVLRPMMQLAVSYAPRIIAGKEPGTFLQRIVETLENPERLVLEL